MKWNQIKIANENFIDAFSKDGVIHRSFELKPEGISPYEAYKSLKNSFGKPTSEMFDEIKSQWQFCLEGPEAFFEVYDWKVMTWSIAVYLKEGITRSAEEIAHNLLALIVAQSKKINSEIKDRLKKPDGIVIENPFLTYRETADSILEVIEQLKETHSKEEAWSHDFSNWMKHYDLCRAAFIMYLSSVEGFINLIYELYLKKDLREKRIYERLYREQIDLKLQLAPIYCECFHKDVINSDDEAFKQFHSLANLRNDFIHANLTKPMMNPVVYEDDYEFVIDVPSGTPIGIPNNFRDFDSSHVQRAKEITRNIIDLIISAMSPRFRREFKAIMDLEYIKVEHENGQIYIT